MARACLEMKTPVVEMRVFRRTDSVLVRRQNHLVKARSGVSLLLLCESCHIIIFDTPLSSVSFVRRAQRVCCVSIVRCGLCSIFTPFLFVAVVEEKLV